MQIHTLYGRPSRPEEEDAIQWMVVQWGAMPAVENMVCLWWDEQERKRVCACVSRRRGVEEYVGVCSLVLLHRCHN